MALMSARKAILLKRFTGPIQNVNVRELIRLSEQAIQKLTVDNFIVEPVMFGSYERISWGEQGGDGTLNQTSNIEGPRKKYVNGYLTIEGMTNGGGSAWNIPASYGAKTASTYNVWLLIE